MNSPAGNLSFTRRLIGHYLVFALAGLLACISIVMVLALRGELLDLAGMAVVVPLVVTIAGAFALQRIAHVNSKIEEQLQRISVGVASQAGALVRLPDAAPVSHGWNTLVQRVQDELALAALDAKLGTFAGTLQQQRWEQTVNSVPDGIIACDRGGTVTHANQSARQILNIGGEAKLVGRNLVDVLEQRFPSLAGPALEDLREGAGILSREIRQGEETAAGVWRVLRTPLLGETHSVGGSVWVLRDVTQQKLADDMRQQFVTAATHELRTPLANIAAYAETLTSLHNIDAEKQKGFYNIIRGEAIRLGRFVDDLLNVTRMEAGGLSLVRSEVEVERLVGEITEKVAPQSQQKQLRFETKLPPKLPKVRADKDKLAAAIVNLLGNAIKYTPEGGWVKLKVEADAAHLRFVVEDSGIGIAADELPKLCQKFFRSRDSRVQELTVSGLGLAFTQEVARLHGGALSVSSELNKGSQFTLSLPLA